VKYKWQLNSPLLLYAYFNLSSLSFMLYDLTTICQFGRARKIFDTYIIYNIFQTLNISCFSTISFTRRASLSLFARLLSLTRFSWQVLFARVYREKLAVFLANGGLVPKLVMPALGQRKFVRACVWPPWAYGKEKIRGAERNLPDFFGLCPRCQKKFSGETFQNCCQRGGGRSAYEKFLLRAHCNWC
jgi:hypothetical protein